MKGIFFCLFFLSCSYCMSEDTYMGVPVYPGVKTESVSDATSDGTRRDVKTYTTGDSLHSVMQFYHEKLPEAIVSDLGTGNDKAAVFHIISEDGSKSVTVDREKANSLIIIGIRKETD
ncbi:MAG: hypothetical protein Q8Q33_06905 [Chlamydiota bacterium]|nr:hypothetical protein [Chlamydiota bacterium]